MKTKVLAVVRVPDRYIKDLALYESLTKDQVNTTINWLSKYDPKIGLEEEAIFEIATKTGLTPFKIKAILSTLVFGCNLLSRYKDNINDFVDDLIDEKLIPNDASENLKIALSASINMSFWLPSADEAYRDILPVVNDIATHCLLTPVLKKGYSSKEETGHDFAKQISYISPAIVVIPSTESKEEQRMSFIITENNLNKIISNLESAKKQLEDFKKYLKI